MELWDILIPVLAGAAGLAGGWFARRGGGVPEVVSAVEPVEPELHLSENAKVFISENPVPEASNPVGFKVRHAQAHSCVVTIPIASKPFRRGPKQCPTCNVKHEVKTIHLNLDENGEAVVSHGVLVDLKNAGMPFLEESGAVEGPPPLIIRPGMTREQVDKMNRQITVRNMIHG